MRRQLFIAILIESLLLAGCASHNLHVDGGNTIAEYRPGKEAELAKAPYDAKYVLHRCQEPPANASSEPTQDEKVNDMFARDLNEGQPIGFEITADGKLLASAGGETIELEAGHYCWDIDPATKTARLTRFAKKAGDCAITVTLFPFEVAAFIVCAPFFLLWGLLVGWPKC